MEAEEEDIDTLHRQIYQLVVEDIPKAVVTYSDMVKERRKLLKEVSKVIEPLNVKKFTTKEISLFKIAGADGGANGKELEGFYFGIAGASLEKLAHLIKVCGFLMQTKVYLFWHI